MAAGCQALLSIFPHLCEVGPYFFKHLEVYWFISAGWEVGIVLIVALGLLAVLGFLVFFFLLVWFFLATGSDSSHNLSLGSCQLAEGCW